MSTDTTILPTVPAYVQIDSNRGNHGHGHNDWNGVTVKDRLAMDADVSNVSVRDTLVAIEKIGAAGELTAEKVASASQLANALGFTNTQNILITGFKDGRYDAAVNAAAAALSACQNTAAIQAAIAECCCETRELIREDGEKTRSLVSTLDNQHLAGLLETANAELAIFRAAKKV